MKLINLKKIIVCGIAFALLMALSACKNDSTKEKESENGKVSLRFSWWGNDDRHKATLAMIKNFEEENPNIKIKGEYSGFGNLEEKITTQMAGGTEADIITILYDWVAKFSPDGKGFYNLSDIKNIDLSTYEPEFLKFGQSKGVQNAIPLGKNVLIIWLNKSAYDRLGVPIPETWEDYVEAAKKFPEGSFPLVATTPRFVATLYLQQKTGLPEFDDKGEMNYSEKDYLEAMTWYKNMVDARVFCSRQDYLENVGTEPVSLAQNKKWLNGEYAGTIAWSGGMTSDEEALKEVGDEIVIPNLPVIDGAKGVNSISKPTMLLAIKKDEQYPEDAGKFVNDFINGKKANQILGLSRGVPESSAAVAALEEDNQLVGAVKKAYDYSQTLETINETPFYENGTLTSIYQQQMDNVELGKSSLKDAAKELYAKTKEEAAKLAKSYKISK